MQEKIYEAPFAASEEDREAFADFVAIVRQLRRDCPWDREQTHASVRHLLIEETYEAVEAIDEEDWEALKEELGDVFLHVLFHSTIAEEDSRFTLKDVMEAEMAKLIRRHPHVFGDVEAEDTDTVVANWEQIKMEEKEKTSALEGVPLQLPALLRAQRIQQKAAGVGFDFPAREDAWEKVEEELEEFRDLVHQDAPAEEKEAEFGDLLFALVNYARFAGVNPENALRATNEKFARRFQHIERRLAESERTLAEADLEEMDRLWEEGKAQEAE